VLTDTEIMDRRVLSVPCPPQYYIILYEEKGQERKAGTQHAWDK